MRLRYFLLVWGLVIGMLAQATEPLDVSDLGEEMPLYGHIAVLADPTDTLTITDIAQISFADRFLPLSQITNKSALYAPDIETYWVRFQLSNQGKLPQNLFLELEHIDRAILYAPSNSPSRPFFETEGGMMLPFSMREHFFGRIPYVHLHIPPLAERTYYVKITFETAYHSQNRAYFFRPLENLSIVPEAVQENYYQKARYYQGFFLGAMVLIALYNLFIFFFVKDSSYLFYTLFIAALALFHMIHEGYALEMLWPDAPYWDMVSMYNVRAVAWIAFTYFAGRFLNLREVAPRWQNALRLIGWLYLGFIVLTLFNYWNLYIFHLLTFLNILVVLSLNIWFVWRRYRPAFFFLLANSFYIVGTLIIQVVLLLNLDFENDIFWHAEEIGDVLQALLFSAALADRINLMRQKILIQDRERAQIIEAQRQQLEEQVQVRTSELVMANQELHSISTVGKKITASLHKSGVIETVYGHLRAAMDVAVFGIALLDESKTRLEFKEFLLDGEPQPPIFMDRHEINRLSTLCLNKQRVIFISDFDNEYQKYIEKPRGGRFIEDRKSLIYLPLIQDDEAIGVLTVQSRQTNAYNERHLNILQTLATYIIVALDNAKAYNAIEEARREISHTNQQITDSLRYAQDIQEVILPETAEMQQLFKDHFVIFRPKDFVSGDYYWVKQKEQRRYIAVADCTGHGVPGAFMSMIGTTLLNQIIDQVEDSPEVLVEILNQLHSGIRKALKQEITGNDDGMDLVLCLLETIDEEQTRVSFAGVKRPLYYTRKGKLREVRGTNKTIGGRIKREGKKSRQFEQHEGILYTGDMCYLTTDGFVDQASPEHVKFGSIRFRELLEQIHPLPPNEQKLRLEQALFDHQRDEEQRDDITLIGIRV